MKKLIFALLTAVLLTTLVGGAVFAAPPVGKGAVQANLYPCGVGESDEVLVNSPAQGKVILNSPDGDVTMIINLIANGLDANTEYAVFIRVLPGYTGASYFNNGYWVILGFFTTDGTGVGNYHQNIRVAELLAGEYDIQIALNPTSELMTNTVLATPIFTALTVGQ